MNNPSGSGSASGKKISNHTKKINEFKEKEKLIPCIKNLCEQLKNQIKSEEEEKKNLLEQLKKEKDNKVLKKTL